MIKVSFLLPVVWLSFGSVTLFAQNAASANQPAQMPGFKTDSGSVALAPDSSEGEAVSSGLNKSKGGFFSNLPVDLTATVRTGYDTNVYYATTNPLGSMYSSVGGSMSHSFSNSRLQIKTLLGGGASIYYSEPGNNMLYTGNFNLDLQYKLAPRLQLTFSNTTQYLPQPSYGLVGGNTQYNSAYIYENAKIDLAVQISPKFSAITSYDFMEFYYLQQAANSTQGYIQQTLSESIQHLFLPKTTLVLEARLSPTTYNTSGQYSVASYLLVGVNQTFNPRLKFTMRTGGEYVTNQNPISGASTQILPFWESRLTYNFGPASSLSWDARFGTESAGMANTNMSPTFRTGFSIMHALTARIALNMGLYYINNRYQQQAPAANYSKNTGEFTFGAMYKINRYMSLELGYSFSDVISQGQSGLDYNRQTFYAGAAFAL